MKPWKTRALSVSLCVGLLLSCGMIPQAAPVSAHVAYGSTEVREILSSIVSDEPVDDALSSIADYDENDKIDSSDVRGLLYDIARFTGDTEVNPRVFRFSSIDDTTSSSGQRTYSVSAPYTDTYTVTPDRNVQNITLSQSGSLLAHTSGTFQVRLEENEVYTLKVTTASPNTAFHIDVQADGHLVTLPYDVLPREGDIPSPYGHDPLTPAEVNYQKRPGGTYIFINNPEQVPLDDVGKGFLRNEDLTGEVYVTFENANYSGKPFYLGYQLKNEGNCDAYITVTNIGYQAGGTWFGQLACYDFYNTQFELPKDYFSNPSKYFQDYAYKNYRPRVYQPTTYRLPAGEAFYVIGGTTQDAYRHINVGNTANKSLEPVTCANGNVKFYVTGGSVTGTFYCYSNPAQVAADPEVLGYRTGGHASAYNGSDTHSGVIDNFMTWTFNDTVASGSLPVTYTNRYAENIPAHARPYQAYDSTDHTVTRASDWMTHLNPQNDHKAVGMDMVTFHCTDSKGNAIVIDNDHADGAGNPSNLGNWMIEYQDHFTLANQGNKERTVTFHFRDHGTLAMLARDGVTGEVLEAKYTCGLGNGISGDTYTYEMTVPAHTVTQITFDYWLVACSYGSVVHSAEIQ